MTVTREVRLRAVRRAFQRSVESNPFADAHLPLVWRRSVARRCPLPLTVRWHYWMRPWLYPDPPALPRMRVIGKRPR